MARDVLHVRACSESPRVRLSAVDDDGRGAGDAHPEAPFIVEMLVRAVYCGIFGFELLPRPDQLEPVTACVGPGSEWRGTRGEADFRVCKWTAALEGRQEPLAYSGPDPALLKALEGGGPREVRLLRTGAPPCRVGPTGRRRPGSSTADGCRAARGRERVGGTRAYASNEGFHN